MRLITYNIRAGLGTDNVRSIRRLGDALKDLSPDLVCLQEVDQRMPRSWPSDQPRFLADHLGMRAVFQRNINLFIGGYGNCILSKYPIADVRRYRLPGNGEPRGLLQVGVSLPEGIFTVFCTHLALEEQVRVKQAGKVSEIVRETNGIKVLCGDMNDVRGSRTIGALMGGNGLVDAGLEIGADETPTIHEPYRSRIDFVLIDPSLNITSYEVAQSDASDHFPVVVDFDFSA